MSETVHYRGIATKIDIPPSKTTLDMAKEILDDFGELEIEMPSYYDDALEWLTGYYDEQFFYHEKTDTLYEITKTIVDEEDDIIRAQRNEDGDIEYELRYYNGGAGFEECLEEAIDNMDK